MKRVRLTDSGHLRRAEVPHSVSVIKDKLFHIQKQLFKKQKAKLVFLCVFLGRAGQGAGLTIHSALSAFDDCTNMYTRCSGHSFLCNSSYPITLYQKNQTVYPAGHPGNRSPLNLFFISWYSSETSSCLTSPAVVLRVRLGFVLFFAKAER